MRQNDEACINQNQCLSLKTTHVQYFIHNLYVCVYVHPCDTWNKMRDTLNLIFAPGHSQKNYSLIPLPLNTASPSVYLRKFIGL